MLPKRLIIKQSVKGWNFFLDESGADRSRILGVGISFPGIIDLDIGQITYSHILGVEAVPFHTVSAFSLIHVSSSMMLTQGLMRRGFMERKKNIFSIFH